MLKIVQGDLKGRPLLKKISQNVRPTSSKIREALFQIIKSDVQGSHWLDLCSGSGIMSMEALSCGAKFATLVEQNRETARTLRLHLKQFNLENVSKVITSDINKYLRRYRGDKVDFIYFDPPYQSQLYEYIFKLLTNVHEELGQPNILIEHPKKLALSFKTNEFSLVDKRTYGDSSISFLKFKIRV